MYYFRSQRYDLGDAKCWVDDNVAGAKRLPGWWEREYNVARSVCAFSFLLGSPLTPRVVWRISTKKLLQVITSKSPVMRSRSRADRVRSVTCEILEETTHPTNPDAHHFRLVAVMAT